MLASPSADNKQRHFINDVAASPSPSSAIGRASRGRNDLDKWRSSLGGIAGSNELRHGVFFLHTAHINRRLLSRASMMLLSSVSL